MPNKLNHRLSAQDASFLYLERPHAPLHIGSLGVYQGQIDYDRFTAHIASRMPNIPRYRQRVVFVPFGLAHPTWEDDPEFDVRRHIKQVTIDPPGTDDQLRDLSCELFAPQLDRSKPLWEMYVINGLEGDRSAILSKVHHCMVDGVSGIALLLAVVDISPEPAPPPEPDGWQPKPLPDLATRMGDAFWDGTRQQMEMWRDVWESVVDPVRRLRETGDAIRALATATPWLTRPAPRTSFMCELSKQRHVAFSEVSFIEIREIRRALGGTVNDVVLAILTGALHKYGAEHGGFGAEPRVMIPVNVRIEEEEGALGNRVSAMITPLPVHESDPAQRMKMIEERIGELKQENQGGTIERVLRMTSYAPAAVHAAVGMAPVANPMVNLICTNVPGPMIPLYAVGHLLLAHYPLVPLSLDMGLGVGVTSYNQKLYFGLMADPRAVPDLDVLKRCLDDSFLELRAAAGVDATDLPPINVQPSNGAAAQRVEAQVTG